MVKKSVIILTAILISTMSVNAESLFTLGASQTYTAAPKSLFSGVRAITIGDLVSIVMEEKISVSDNLSFDSSKASKTVDNFTTFLNNLFNWDMKNSNNYGGENSVSNSTATKRSMAFDNTVAAQVTQLLSNGNMLVQGKKTIVNGNERMDLIVTGIVDPRWINAKGEISSTKVSNLQFALSGRGTASRGQNEGILNRAIRYLF